MEDRKYISEDGMGEMCRRCKNAIVDWDETRTSYSFECRKDCGVFWDEEEECEDCDGVDFYKWYETDWY